MTSAEIYSMVCDMLLDYLKQGGWTENAVTMHVYAACGMYPQCAEWFTANHLVQNVIHVVV